jgi:hypothetical protein
MGLNCVIVVLVYITVCMLYLFTGLCGCFMCLQDCVRELKKVSQFLGLDCSDDLLAAITAKCSFSAMAADKLKSDAPLLKMMSKDGSSHPIYRKG